MTTRQIEPLNLHDEPERPGGNGPTKPRSAYLARQMLIGGAWRDARSGKTLVVENPARREPIGEVPRAQAEDVDLAVEAAAAAYPAWAHTPPRERGRALLAIAEALEARQEEMARLIASETGNAIRTQARGEARWVVDTFRYFGGLAGELKGITVPLGETIPELHPPRTAWGGRRHRTLERTGPTRLSENRPGDLRRK
jgi:acyl-CoA reductase-like NAD-dependent aldehyde dehydrogenase